MASILMTTVGYTRVENAVPGSAVAVETAVPVFMGYTEIAVRNGKSLIGKPTRISSLVEYRELFGGGFQSKCTIAPPADPNVKEETFNLNGEETVVNIKPNNTAYFYHSIRLFYANGGSSCFIYSVGTYGSKPEGFEIKASDFTGGNAENPLDVFEEILAKEHEPTLVVIPDIIALGKPAYDVYVKVLSHCFNMQSRMGIFDLKKQTIADKTSDVVLEFRTGIGNNNL